MLVSSGEIFEGLVHVEICFNGLKRAVIPRESDDE